MPIALWVFSCSTVMNLMHPFSQTCLDAFANTYSTIGCVSLNRLLKFSAPDVYSLNIGPRPNRKKAHLDIK